MHEKRKDPSKILGDPLRVRLFELIKEGSKTTVELADILGKDRMELYHHLKQLEDAGLVSSSYNTKRMKEYQATSTEPQIQHMEQTTLINPFKNEMTGLVILSPPAEPEQYREFRNYIEQAAKLCGSSVPDDFEIIQVQVRTESKTLEVAKNENIMDELSGMGAPISQSYGSVHDFKRKSSRRRKK
ncbi:MAG: helix-turn-helix domain-containing protein [Candidatus Kariarchaeaceae archaeon]|jgi:DNA-binding transcriptional ArsR family regulator